MRGRESDAVVRPVVPEPKVEQAGVVHELMDGKELDCSDAEVRQVPGDRRMGQTGVRATDLFRKIGMTLRESSHVGLENDRLLQGDTEPLVTFPIEGAFGDHASRHRRCRVEIVEALGMVKVVSEDRLTPQHLSVDGRCMGVQQELRRIAAQPVRWIPRTVHPQSVALARTDIRQEAVPDVGRTFGQRHALLGSIRSSKRQTSTASATSDDTRR